MDFTIKAPCNDVIDDIEDLISSDDLTSRERFNNRRGVVIRVKKKQKQEAPPVPKSALSNIPGTQTIYIKTWGCAHNSSDSEYMAGQLAAYGYFLTEEKEKADLWLLNSCTVKNPAEDHFRNEINAAKKLGKYIVLAGCVPQGAQKLHFIQGLSVIGVHQIDRVVEVVEETLKGNTVSLFGTKKKDGKKSGGASLSLPKIRRNPLIEIIAINTGCLNHCTYCKTKHARGNLGSYPPEEIIARARQAFQEGVVEIWLTSEDTGTYGMDIGTSLPTLLWKLIEEIPEGCRLRLGMTNPPYIMKHLNEMAKILNHPRVYSFLHIPVQSGSDSVLSDMKRQYNIAEFKYVVNFLRIRIPGITIATDIICGFPTETGKDFEETLALCSEYKFPNLFINQFYPRPGTPAARLPRIPAQEVKKRTKQLTDLFHSYHPYSHKVGEIHEVLITDISHDKKSYVGHNKFYEQMLVPMDKEYMGKLMKVKVIESKKFSMICQPVDKAVAPGLSKPLPPGQVSGLPVIDEPSKLPYAIAVLLFAVLIRIIWLLM